MRKPMITRTIKTTNVTVLALDVVTAEPQNVTVSLARTFKDDNKLKKAVEELVNTDTLKVVHIVDKTEVEKLMGMTEQKFIDTAVELDPSTRKPLDATDETEEVEDEE